MIHSTGVVSFKNIIEKDPVNLAGIKNGDVVALIGDFDPQSIINLLELINKRTIIVPLTTETKAQHKYFFDAALVDVVIEGSSISRIKHNNEHKLIEELRSKKHAGLVLFSYGHYRQAKSNLT